MKAILKIIWFALVVVLIQRFGANIIETNVGILADKLVSNFPENIQNTLKLDQLLSVNTIKQLVFVIGLFLGLDIISGDIKGLIKGPVKLAFNGVLYLIGFSVIFFLLNEFSIVL